MTTFTKIKYRFLSHQLANQLKLSSALPKYFVLVSLFYSTLAPLPAGALNVASTQNSKPALLAMAQTQPLVSLISDDNKNTANFTTLFGTTMARQTNPAAQKQTTEPPKFSVLASIVDDSEKQSVKETRKNIIVTAYSSTPDQTDDSPFVTAKGTRVRDGIVAANWLPFGTKIRLPEFSGDKIYIVEDRMAKRNSHKVDIWMESRSLALQFGVKRLTIEIVE